jgi:hypothetical protein
MIITRKSSFAISELGIEVERNFSVIWYVKYSSKNELNFNFICSIVLKRMKTIRFYISGLPSSEPLETEGLQMQWISIFFRKKSCNRINV